MAGCVRARVSSAIKSLVKALAQIPKLMIVLVTKVVPMAIRLMTELIKVVPAIIRTFVKSFKYITKNP
jgi:hypothetical protein